MKRKIKVVDPRFAKGKKYRKIIERIGSAGVCPFCPKHFTWHTEPILKSSLGWILTRNFNPYKNAAHHFMIISKKHKEQFRELTAEDFRGIATLINWAIKKFNIKGGGIALRFGDTTYTGATVCHLHAHLIVPRVTRDKARTVEFPIG